MGKEASKTKLKIPAAISSPVVRVPLKKENATLMSPKKEKAKLISPTRNRKTEAKVWDAFNDPLSTHDKRGRIGHLSKYVAAQVLILHDGRYHLLYVRCIDSECLLGTGGSHALFVGQRG